MLKCPFCLNSDCFNLRFDKKNKPFFSCELCRHKVFIMSGAVIGSIYMWCKTLESCDAEFVKQVAEQARSFVKSGDLYSRVSKEDLILEKLPVKQEIQV